jgi:hypothetical protein
VGRAGLEDDAPKFIAHVPLPDLKDIEQVRRAGYKT